MPLVPSVPLESSHVDPSDPGAARPMRRVRHGVCLPGARGRGGGEGGMEEELEDEEEEELEDEGRCPVLRGVMVIE